MSNPLFRPNMESEGRKDFARGYINPKYASDKQYREAQSDARAKKIDADLAAMRKRKGEPKPGSWGKSSGEGEFTEFRPACFPTLVLLLAVPLVFAAGVVAVLA